MNQENILKLSWKVFVFSEIKVIIDFLYEFNEEQKSLLYYLVMSNFAERIQIAIDILRMESTQDDRKVEKKSKFCFIRLSRKFVPLMRKQI